MDLNKNLYILKGALKNTSGTANPRLYEDLKELVSNIVESKLTGDDMSLILKQVYWKLLGNDINIAADPNANFLGTTTNYPLTFRVNNIRAGRLSDENPDSSTIFGVYANNNLINNNSTVVGHNAARTVSAPSTNNVVVGNYAASNTRSLLNSTIIGESAGSVLTDVSNSVIIGNDAVKGHDEEGSKYSSGSVVIGNNAAKDAFHAYGVTIIGHDAAQDWTGIKSGIFEGLVQSGNYASVIIGKNAAKAATGTYDNVIIGANAGMSDKGSDSCVFIGSGAAEFLNNENTTIFPSVAVGSSALRSGGSFHAPKDGWINVANTAIGTNSQTFNEYGFSNVTVGYLSAPYLGSEPSWNEQYFSHAAGNTIVGPEAGINTAYAQECTFIGFRAGGGIVFTPVEGETYNGNNIAIGSSAMYAKYGVENIAIGFHAFSQPLNHGGPFLGHNIAIGTQSLDNLLEGMQNIGCGASSLLNLTNGTGNVALGTGTAVNLTEGDYNIVIGQMTGVSLTEGSKNVIIGMWADVDETVSYATTIGTESEAYFNYGLALGYRAKSLGVYSTALGTLSQAEANSISIGYNTQTTGDSSIAIGNNLNITEDNVAVIGAVNGFTRVGMGTTTPAEDAALHIEAHGKGFLPPKLTTVQRDLILTPTEGLLIYNTTDHKLQCYDGSAWQSAW